jgi:nitroreductase
MTNYDDLLDLLRTRRSVRAFTPEPVSDEDIKKILEAARWAMSGGNAQPWEFLVVNDRKDCDTIIAAKDRSHDEIIAIEETRSREMRLPALLNRESYIPFKDAPVLIAVLADKRAFQATLLADHFLDIEHDPEAIFHKGIGNATQNMMLAAHALGLSAAWLSVDKMWERFLKDFLNIPALLDVPTVVAVGHNKYKPQPGVRRPLEEMVHFGKYDMSKFRTGHQIVEYISSLRNKTNKAYNDLEDTK